MNHVDFSNIDPVWRSVDEKSPEFTSMSDRIWATPETNYQEFSSCREHIAALEREGFKIHRDLVGIPTAFMAEAGEGGPVIAILGEYDALPGLSQIDGLAERRPLDGNPSGNGHGCGHNILGAASSLAATAVKDYLSKNNLPGRVRFYGCPAEEGGSAKGFMVRAGAFDDVDVAITWHPYAFNGVARPHSLSCVEFQFDFRGKASHASVDPHLGRSALDAVELMNIGVNYLREHMPVTGRLHYAVVNTGGNAPNVVQSFAAVRHVVRDVQLADMWDLTKRVQNIAQGAAQMTETRVDWHQLCGDANLVPNEPLEQAMYEAMCRLGGPGFDDSDRSFANEIRKTLSKAEILAAYKRAGLKFREDEVLSEGVYTLNSEDTTYVGSTDVGTVSWVVPTVQCHVACHAIGTPGHSWQVVAQGKSGIAHKGLIHAAKVMSSTAVRLYHDSELLAEAKKAHADFRAESEFVFPIGESVTPALDMAVTA